MKPEATTFSEMNQAGTPMPANNPSTERPMALSEMQAQDLARPLSFIELMRASQQDEMVEALQEGGLEALCAGA